MEKEKGMNRFDIALKKTPPEPEKAQEKKSDDSWKEKVIALLHPEEWGLLQQYGGLENIRGLRGAEEMLRQKIRIRTWGRTNDGLDNQLRRRLQEVQEEIACKEKKSGS